MAEKEFYGRTLARSQALQLMFQAEATGRTVEEVLAGDFALSQGPLDDYARELAVGADSMRSVLDAIISGASTNWAVGRMPAVDRNLLRLALYEMLYEDDVAVAVTIDEVVELAKAYGTDESSRFINGLLGKVASDLDSGVDVVSQARQHVEEESQEATESEAEGEESGVDQASDDAAGDEEDKSDWYGFDDDPYYWDDDDEGEPADDRRDDYDDYDRDEGWRD